MTTQVQNQKGFTLVEIAIVLVIIGLLLGGVLKGQEMINSAKIKTDTDSLVAFQASAYAYRDRTGQYPGAADDAKTVFVDATAATVSATDFFGDLAQQGFLKNENPIVEHDAGASFRVANAARIAGGETALVNQICMDNVADTVVVSGIDAKLDDGVATTGTVRTAAGTTADTFQVCLEM